MFAPQLLGLAARVVLTAYKGGHVNRGELRNLCLYWLDDLNGTYFTATQVNQWLNNAQYEVQKQLIAAGQYWYATPVTAYTIANTESYALPTDFFQCHKLEILTQGAANSPIASQQWAVLENMTLMESATLTNYGTALPSAYTIVKNCLYLRAIPDLAYLMRMFYSYIVSPMTDDLNVPAVPLQFMEYVAVVAAFNGFIKDDRAPSNLQMKADYYVALMKQTDIQRDRSKPRHVRRTMGDGQWGF